MNTFGGVEVFLKSALDGGEWLATRSCHFTPEKEPLELI